MLADLRCIEGKVPRYCPPPPELRNIGGADPGTLRYINNNALQISQDGRYLILSIVLLHVYRKFIFPFQEHCIRRSV